MLRDSTFVQQMRRAARKPPRVLAQRGLDEVRTRLDRVLVGRRARALDEAALLEALSAESLEGLWQRLSTRPYPFVDDPATAVFLTKDDPAERERILAAAQLALDRTVDLLGSGPVGLGSPIDWRRDPKTGRRWPLSYGRTMDYANLDEPSDVKLPWEISRLQWLLPAGQAYLVTGDERYAAAVRDVLADWIEANPYAQGPNWAIAMEPALRILSWTWLFRACRDSEAFADPQFRLSFLQALYLHGEFVERNLERSDVNGNHYTADAAGLVFAGLFFGGGNPVAWADAGWQILTAELPRQVHSDGVDFEASTAYHRLVAELFTLPALYRLAAGLRVESSYRERLLGMGRFAAAYIGPDGQAPLWGDADDGRALPLVGAGEAALDHRSLPALIGAGLDVEELQLDLGGSRGEIAWLLGPAAAASLRPARPGSQTYGFPAGGAYVLAGGGDHVFVDCGPVGLAGRGGHGHNDCLSFEAVLDGTRLVSDAGSYVYTASPSWRNRFRATASHNTPRIDGVEQNRIPESLWLLEDDAKPTVHTFEERGESVRFRGSHAGYLRLPDPVSLLRTIALDRRRHVLVVHDVLEGLALHELEVPLLLAPGVEPRFAGDGFTLVAGEQRFRLDWSGSEGWECRTEPAWVSPSYGIKVEATRLLWRATAGKAWLTVTIAPASTPDGVVTVVRRGVLET